MRSINFSRFGLLLFLITMTITISIYPQSPGITPGYSPSEICGDDHRKECTDLRVGRLLGFDSYDQIVGVGTAFVINNGLLISAGHLKYDLESIGAVRYEVEFNVKPSSSVGQIVRSEPDSIYHVIEEYYSNKFPGQDAWIFEVARNSITGLLPSDIASYEYVTNIQSSFLDGAKLSVIGYGRASGSKNNTQQIAEGNYLSSHFEEPNMESCDVVYDTDTDKGCSGGPIIVTSQTQYKGKVIGIHTGPYGEPGINPCENYGTTLNQYDIALYLNTLNPYKTVQVWKNLKRWWNGEFKPYNLDTEIIPNFLTLYFKIDDNETFLENKNVVSNTKFYKWDGYNYYQNHKTFEIDTDLDKIEPFREYVKGSVTIKNKSLESENFNVGDIIFKDPWLELERHNSPYWDEPFGFRNLGFDANWEPNSSPFIPSINSVYKGVFLNQEIVPNKPYYSVQAPLSFKSSLSHTGRNHTFYFKSWESTNAQLAQVGSNPSGFDQKAVVFTNDNATINANYKGTFLTNNSSSFANNGQRRLVKMPNGLLHIAYESNNKIYWDIDVEAPNGEHSNFLEVYHSENSFADPSFAYYVDDLNTKIVLTFRRIQEPNDVILARIHSFSNAPLEFSSDLEAEFELDIQSEISYVALSKPVVAYHKSGDIMIVFESFSDEVYGNLGYWYYNSDSEEWFRNEIIYSAGGKNPSIDVYQDDERKYFHLAWEYDNTIKYAVLEFNDQTNSLNYIDNRTISSGSGYTQNSYPSITVMDDGEARLVWHGQRVNYQEAIEKRVIFKSSDYYYFWSFGNNTTQPNINRHSNGYAFAWSENEGNIVKAVNNTLNQNNIKTLTNLKGTGVQVSNGSSINSMYALSLNYENLPYFFQPSNALGSYGLSKENTHSMSVGREGVVFNNKAQFYFALGDVSVNGTTIDFIDIPDTIRFEDYTTLNEYMRTESFPVNNNCEFLYSVQYGITDSQSTASYLQNGFFVSFAIELVDASNNEILGRFDEVTYNANNMYSYNNIAYEIETEGIGNREVYLRLITLSGSNAGYSLTKRYSDDFLISKNHVRKVNYKGLMLPTEYSLSQNYPNPFNPVTTINYQIPKDGFVSLKVYDILGKEIVTLLNNDKAQGRYTVEFDGSRFASGMYIYKLQSGDFVETRKMMLLK